MRIVVLLSAVVICCALNQQQSVAYSGSTFIEANELRSMCEGVDDQGNATNTMAVGCSQFVIGVHDTMSTLTFGGLLDKGFVCFPEDYSGPQLALIVKKYLEENPDKVDEPANMLVAVAFVESFPCPKE
ncbi:MAG: Rap1a/Tai family immunity protein [Gammaproteobacteria bacterium]